MKIYEPPAEPQERLSVIALTGRARAGKDSVAGILAERGYRRIGLADVLRETFVGMDGPTWELSKELESAGTTRRKSLQLYGTECRDVLARNLLWVDALLVKIIYLSRFHPVPRFKFVIPDLRYGYEAGGLGDAIRAWGGEYQLWRVRRPGQTLIAESGHSSELEVDSMPVDATIANNGNLGDLRDKVIRKLESPDQCQRHVSDEKSVN